MDSYLTLLSATRSPTSNSPRDVRSYKQSARHRKRPTATNYSTSSSQDSPLRLNNFHGAFRSVAVLGEVMRLEADANRTKLQPEDAFALLKRILSSQDLLSGSGEKDEEVSVAELLDGIDAACWQTLAAETNSASPNHASSHCDAEANAREANVVRVRFSQLYSGVQAAILEKRRLLSSLLVELRRAVERNDELPRAISEREAVILRLKQTFVADATKLLSCDGGPTSSSSRGRGGAHGRVAAAALAVDEKVQTLRRRRDLRAWACTELRTTINDHLTHASELKKEISSLVADVKREEVAHKLKAKRIEAIMAATSRRGVAGHHVSASTSSVNASPEDLVARTHEKKLQLLDEIEQRKTQLRARTEQVFNARNEVGVLELKCADVAAHASVLEHEIAHIQRACTPRPEWTQLLKAATVTTAVDRAGKKAKLRMENSRKKLMGGKTHENDVDEHEESSEQRLKQLLTSNWSTVDKVYAMATELTRIRTKYHAGDTITVEQAKLDHLQREIAKALQQLELIKAKSVE